MNQLPLVFLGSFAAMAASFWGLILVPQATVGRKMAAQTEDTGAYYPLPRDGTAQQGADVYRAQGCVECHTQQVRPKGVGSDFARGWGRRRTIAEDYLLDGPVQLGSVRLGPDLTNIGRRQPNATHHLQHLYNPRLVAPDSIMPRYTYLFEVRKLAEGEKLPPDALPAGTEPGHAVTPKAEARLLVAYLQSLSADSALRSAPFPITPTNAPVSGAKAPPK